MKWLLALAVVLLAAAPASAVDEADAPNVDARIAEVGHLPAEPAPGTQWDGFIRFHPGHNVTDVAIKVCRVGVFCNIFGPLADRIDDDTWQFNTAGKTVGGGSVDWGINDMPGDDSDWRIGVQYYVFTDDMNVDTSDGLSFEELEQAQPLPHAEACGVDLSREAWVACEETHYFAFDMEGRPPQNEDAPGPAVAFTALLLLGAAFWSRRA